MSKELKTFKVVLGQLGQFTSFSEGVTAQEVIEKVLRDNFLIPLGIPNVSGDYVRVFSYNNLSISAEIIPSEFPTEPKEVTLVNDWK
jgi:hypothetical protein